MGLVALAAAVMLTGMSSLASLAGPAVAPGFNATLDSTVATIIPVLFLALGVQRHLYQDLLKAYYNAAAISGSGPGPGRAWSCRCSSRSPRVPITTFILVYGTVGEVDAILARRTASGRLADAGGRRGRAGHRRGGRPGLGAAARLPQRDAAAQPGGFAAAGGSGIARPTPRTSPTAAPKACPRRRSASWPASPARSRRMARPHASRLRNAAIPPIRTAAA